jgi:hypothetical protein
MTLRQSDSPPPDAFAVLRNNLVRPPAPQPPPPQAAVLGQNMAAALILPEVEGEPVALAAGLHVARPQPIYTSTIDALLENRLLSDARLTGWQYVLVLNGEADGVAEVAGTKGEPAGPLSFASMYAREYARAVADTIAHAEAIPGDYALRMLRVPSLYLFAVWLRSGFTGDLLLPVPPAPNRLEEEPLFTEQALTTALRAFAMRRRDDSDDE